MKSLTLILLALSLQGSEFDLMQPLELTYKPSVTLLVEEDDHKDNGRTFAASIQSNGFGLSYSMLTDLYNPPNATGTNLRDDESNLYYIHSFDWFEFGIGIRYYGDLRGNRIQYWVHTHIYEGGQVGILDSNAYQLHRFDLVKYTGVNKYWDVSEYKIGLTAFNDISTFGEINLYGFSGIVSDHWLIGPCWNWNWNSPSWVKDKWYYRENYVGCKVGFIFKNFTSELIFMDSWKVHYRFSVRF